MIHQLVQQVGNNNRFRDVLLNVYKATCCMKGDPAIWSVYYQRVREHQTSCFGDAIFASPIYYGKPQRILRLDHLRAAVKDHFIDGVTSLTRSFAGREADVNDAIFSGYCFTETPSCLTTGRTSLFNIQRDSGS